MSADRSSPTEIPLSDLQYFRARCAQLERELGEARIRIAELEERLWRVDVANEHRVDGNYRLDLARRVLVRVD